MGLRLIAALWILRRVEGRERGWQGACSLLFLPRCYIAVLPRLNTSAMRDTEIEWEEIATYHPCYPWPNVALLQDHSDQFDTGNLPYLPNHTQT